MVEERTKKLAKTNRELEHEIKNRRQAEKDLSATLKTTQTIL